MRNRVTSASAVFLALALFFCVIPAAGSVISGSVTGGSAHAAGSVFEILEAPLSNPYGALNSVGDCNFRSPNLYALNEASSIILSYDLPVDIGVGPIAKGTRIASHYVFFEPGNVHSLTGKVKFDGRVLGVITSTLRLAESDWITGTGVNYLTPALRGIETAEDSVAITGLDEITLSSLASNPGDHVRVLTEVTHSPEPATAVVVLAGLAVVWRFRPRR